MAPPHRACSQGGEGLQQPHRRRRLSRLLPAIAGRRDRSQGHRPARAEVEPSISLRCNARTPSAISPREAGVAVHVSVTAHLLVVAVGIGSLVPLSTRGFLPDTPEPSENYSQPAGSAKADAQRSGGALARWREPRTLIIGVVVLAFAFSEGVNRQIIWPLTATLNGRCRRRLCSLATRPLGHLCRSSP